MFLREKLAITDIENKEQSSIQLSYQVTTIVIMVPVRHVYVFVCERAQACAVRLGLGGLCRQACRTLD